MSSSESPSTLRPLIGSQRKALIQYSNVKTTVVVVTQDQTSKLEDQLSSIGGNFGLLTGECAGRSMSMSIFMFMSMSMSMYLSMSMSMSMLMSNNPQSPAPGFSLISAVEMFYFLAKFIVMWLMRGKISGAGGHKYV